MKMIGLFFKKIGILFADLGRSIANAFNFGYILPNFRRRNPKDDAKNLKQDWEKVLGDFDRARKINEDKQKRSH